MENNEPIEQLNNEVVNSGTTNSVIIGKKEDLPKYTLPRGERLYITREQLTELNDNYNVLLSDLKESRETLPAELRSIMESVIGKAYLEDIEELRLDNRLSMDTERERKLALIGMLTPRTWRSWFFRRKRNQPQILLDELVRRQATQFLRDRADELPVIGDNEAEGAEQNEALPFEVIMDSLRCSLSHLRKKRREIAYDLTEELYEAFNSKKEECKRLFEELEENKKQLEKALERATAAEERLDEFLKESTPEPEEAVEEAEQKQEQKESSPKEEGGNSEGKGHTETEQGEQSPETTETEEKNEGEPADEEEDEGLSYDGLGEDDGQE